jgi:hypothetical protein
MSVPCITTRTSRVNAISTLQAIPPWLGRVAAEPGHVRKIEEVAGAGVNAVLSFSTAPQSTVAPGESVNSRINQEYLGPD